MADKGRVLSLRQISFVAALALGLAAAAAGAPAPPSYPLSLDLRALKLAPNGSGSYVVIVRNSSGRRTAPITLSLNDLSVGGAGTQVGPVAGTVRADIALRTVPVTGGHGYLGRLPDLAAGADTRIDVDATAATLRGSPLTCLTAAVYLGDKAPPVQLSSVFPAALESFCAGPGQVTNPAPIPFSVEVQGPAETRTGAKATYTVTVTSRASTVIRDGRIGLSQVNPVTHRPFHVATDWPVTRTTVANGQEALLTHLAPGASVTFHVTMRVPGPVLTTDGTRLYFTTFGVDASRTSQPRESLRASLLSTLHHSS